MTLDNKEAAHLAGFVQFAYNMFKTGGLLPVPDPGLDKEGYDLIYHLNALDFKEKRFYGYLAKSRNNPGEYVFVVRGTADFSEWLLDFAGLPVIFKPAPNAGFVALGFYSIFKTFELIDDKFQSSSLNDVVTKLSAGGGIKRFIVVGHSLGGALATLAAAQLALNNPGGVQDQLEVYTFGSPRVGLLDFAASFNKAVKTSYRVWNALDVVPEVPTFPFIHVSGLGDTITQNEAQLTTLKPVPTCEHHVTTYQWLLDPDEFPLGPSCELAAAPAAFAFGEPDEQIIGAQALLKAYTGRV